MTRPMIVPKLLLVIEDTHLPEQVKERNFRMTVCLLQLPALLLRGHDDFAVPVGLAIVTRVCSEVAIFLAGSSRLER